MAAWGVAPHRKLFKDSHCGRNSVNFCGRLGRGQGENKARVPSTLKLNKDSRDKVIGEKIQHFY